MTGLLDDLVSVLGSGLLVDLEDRTKRARDSWMRSQIPISAGKPAVPPIAVATPTDTDQLAEVVRICRSHRAPMVPRGGGSGVVGGVLASTDSVVISTERMTGLHFLDSDDLLATFGAGTNGWAAEQRMEAVGLTIGHWPQSIEESTVGGWVATRASGQYSTAYGNIEDLVAGLEAVLPDGSIYRSRATPRAASGPDLRHVLIGSEGALGIISNVTFSVRALPEPGIRQAFHFAGFADGIGAVRDLMGVGWRPAVVRLYDPDESSNHFADQIPAGRSMLILLHEGPPGVAPVQAAAVEHLCRNAGGEPAPTSVVDAWFENRNETPTWDELIRKGVVADTIEIATSWSKLPQLHTEVLAALRAVPGVVAAGAHSSHAYRSGANLYITVAAVPEKADDFIPTYDACWAAAMGAAARLGAGLAHHHGIGRVRLDWISEELGPGGLALLRTIKSALDPDDLMNPGVLLPPH